MHTSPTRLRIQLWSYNFAPEPTGIGPISAAWACAMRARGHDVEVVAAHPHYPAAAWGVRLLPYRETRDGVPVLRLPIWPGRATTAARLRQELGYTAALTLAVPTLGRPDVVVAVSPSFPALAPTLLGTRMRGIPWVLWLQDILPDGAVATSVMREGPAIRLARRLERAAYRSARHVVVLSRSFEANLVAKGVPAAKIVRTYNPATRPARREPRDPADIEPGTAMTMGNVGFSQGLERIVEAFQTDGALTRRGARFLIAGDGAAAGAVRAAIRTDRVRLPGILNDDALGRELRRAQVAVVTQHYEGEEFNVPSKLMNFLGEALPVVASVRPASEAARIVREAGAGWVVDSKDLGAFTRTLEAALADPEECRRRGEAGRAFALAHLTPEQIARVFEPLLAPR